MTLRVIDKVAGFVHDIEKVKALSDSRSNIRLLSDRSLYILQNLSGEDVTFLSRYGEIETGGQYIPVPAGTSDAEEVYDAVNLIRRDLNDMLVEDALTCICEELGAIAAGISAAQAETCTGTIGSDVETTDGQTGGPLPDPVNGVPYDQPSGIDDRKCKAANYIHGGISDVVTELRLNRADKYGFAGLAFVLSLVTTIVGTLLLGPFGLLLGAVAGSFLAMATLLFKASFSLTLLETAITADQDGAICTLFEAGTSGQARADYSAHLSGEGATALEIEFVEHLLTNNLLNLLFFGWGDSEEAIDNTPIISDCSSCVQVLEQWLFPANDEGWTFVDESTGSAVASMIYNGGAEALRDSHLVPEVPSIVGQVRDTSPAISHDNAADIEITVVFSKPTDDILTAIQVGAEFAASADEEDLITFTEAGTHTYVFTTVDEITAVTVLTGRQQGGSPIEEWEFDVDIIEVTLRRL